MPAAPQKYGVTFVVHNGALRAVLRPEGDFLSALYNCLLLRHGPGRRLPVLRKAPGLVVKLLRQVELRTGSSVPLLGWGSTTEVWPEGTRAAVHSEHSERPGHIRLRLRPRAAGSQECELDVPVSDVAVEPIAAKDLLRLLYHDASHWLDASERVNADPKHKEKLRELLTEFWERLLGPVEDGLIPELDSPERLLGPRYIAALLRLYEVPACHAFIPDPERDPAAVVYGNGHSVLSLLRQVTAAREDDQRALFKDPGAWTVPLPPPVRGAPCVVVRDNDGSAFPPEAAAADISQVLSTGARPRSELRPGMRLMAVDGWTIRSARDAEEALRHARPGAQLLVAEGVTAAETPPPAGAEVLLHMGDSGPVWAVVLDGAAAAEEMAQPGILVRLYGGTEMRVPLQWWRAEYRARRRRPCWQIRPAPSEQLGAESAPWQRLEATEEDALDAAAAREADEVQIGRYLVLVGSQAALDDRGQSWELRRLPPLDTEAAPLGPPLQSPHGVPVFGSLPHASAFDADMEEAGAAPADSGCGAEGLQEALCAMTPEREMLLCCLRHALPEKDFCELAEELETTPTAELHNVLVPHLAATSHDAAAEMRRIDATTPQEPVEARAGAARACERFLNSTRDSGMTRAGLRMMKSSAALQRGQPFVFLCGGALHCAAVVHHEVYMLSASDSRGAVWRRAKDECDVPALDIVPSPAPGPPMPQWSPGAAQRRTPK